jgi:hypothetical protein
MSPRSGGREVAMLAPDQPRSVGEIADDVVELFSSAKEEAVRYAAEIAEPKSAENNPSYQPPEADPRAQKAIIWAAGAAIGFDAQSTIQRLRLLIKTGKPLYDFEKENTAAVESVRDSIVELQSALRTMPIRAQILLFASELSGNETEISSAEILNRAQQRGRAISGTLAVMLARCMSLLETKPGKHGGADWIQQLCSDSAWDLLLRHGKQPTGANSADSLLRRVARLFYEGVTGKDIDLENACRKTFERNKKKAQRKKR